MVQRRILKREQNETIYDNVVEVLNLQRKINVRMIGSSLVNRKVNELYRKNNVNRVAPMINGNRVAEFNRNTTETQNHALKLIGSRRINEEGKIEFIPMPNPKLLNNVKTMQIITSLQELKSIGFSTIYSGYNASHEFKVGACKDFKAPSYARYEGNVMKIDYAISLVSDLNSFSLTIRSHVRAYVAELDIKNKRIHYKNEIQRADRDYARKIERNAKIIDVAMQGFKKKDKIRALHNLCINQGLEDSEFYSDYERKARTWIEENAWDDNDEIETKARLNSYANAIGFQLRNIDCNVSIAKKIYNAERRITEEFHNTIQNL